MQIPVNQIQLLLNVIELANRYDFPEVKNKIAYKIANFLKVHSEKFMMRVFHMHMHELQIIIY